MFQRGCLFSFCQRIYIPVLLVVLLKNSVPYACMVLESCRVKGLCSATVTLDKDKLRACGLQGPFFEALFLLMWDRIVYEQPLRRGIWSCFWFTC